MLCVEARQTAGRLSVPCFLRSAWCGAGLGGVRSPSRFPPIRITTPLRHPERSVAQ